MHGFGPSVRVVRRTGQSDSMADSYRLVSSPHPIHWGTVTFIVGRWVAQSDTLPSRPLETFHARQLRDAVEWLGRLIGTQYRADLRARFTGPQRLAMGRGQCPAHRPCRDRSQCPIERADHAHLCKELATTGSIWCPTHGGGADG